MTYKPVLLLASSELGELNVFVEEDNLETNFCYFLHPFYCLFYFKENKQQNKNQDDKA